MGGPARRGDARTLVAPRLALALEPGGARLLAAFGGVQELLGHDARVQHLDEAQSAPSVAPRTAPAGVGVLHIFEPVPGQAADIELVGEDAGAALPVAVDGGLAPGRAARAGDAVAIETHSDRTRRSTFDILVEDTVYDPGLVGIDDAIAAVAFTCPMRIAIAPIAGLVDTIAVAQPAAGAAVEHAAFEPAPDFFGEQGQGDRVHGAGEGDMERGNFALGQRYDGNAEIREPLVEAGGIFLIAREAVERNGNSDIECAGACVIPKLLIRRPERGGAAHGAILVGADEGRALAQDESFALPDLVLDRGIALILGAVSGVHCDAHQCLRGSKLPSSPCASCAFLRKSSIKSAYQRDAAICWPRM